MDIESIWELRRKAPHHYHARACNALSCAKLLYELYDMSESTENCDLDRSKISFPNRFALREGYQREAALAVELVLKSVICAERKQAPIFKHDVLELWSDAGLPKPTNDDKWRLTLLSEILYWSGRYPAPKKDEDLIKERKRFETFQRTEMIGKLKFHKSEIMNFCDIETLFKIADQKFWELVS